MRFAPLIATRGASVSRTMIWRVALPLKPQGSVAVYVTLYVPSVSVVGASETDVSVTGTS